MRQESQKPGIASNNAFVLVEWCSLLLTALAGTPLWDKFGLEIVQTDAAALEKCLQSSTRPSVAQSALVVTRRGLRAAFWRKELRKKAIQDTVQALTAKGAQSTARNAVILGVVAGVCSRNAHAKEVLAAKKPEYFTFFTREIVGSRTPVPAHIATGLRDFFSDFVTPEDLDKDVIPPIEKGLLRAPEVVLDLTACLLRALPETLDLSQVLNGHLLKPLLSNAKSSNATIREGALAVFKATVARSQDAKITEQVADEVLNPLKSGKLASADHRILHSQMLEHVPLSSSIATKVATGLPPIAAKEGNEGALGAEISVISRAVFHLLNDGTDLPKPVVDAFVKGLGDKKIPSRRLWLLRAGEVFIPFSKEAQTVPESAVKLAEAIASPVADTWAEIIKNPAAAAQSGLIVGAYVFSALSLQVLSKLDSTAVKSVLKKTAVSKECLVADPKPSFLLNHRVYSRLTTEDDTRWFLRALAAIYDDALKASKTVQIAWFQAFIYLVSSATVPPPVRKEACETISKLYVRDTSSVSGIAIDGLWQWVESSLTEDKDSVAASAKFENAHLHLVLRSICPSDEEFKELGAQKPQEELAKQMCSLLVIARNDLIPKANWIDIVLRVGLDPGSLAQKYEKLLLQQIKDKTSFDQKVRTPVVIFV